MPGEITITGGKITATGGEAGAGIGGGYGQAQSNVGDGGKITITGGDITATGGSGYDAGAGIGGGRQGSGGEIIILGGKIKATGGNNQATWRGISGGGAGIGGGGQPRATDYNTGEIYIVDSGKIYIVDGVIEAQGGYGAAGVGGGGVNTGIITTSLADTYLAGPGDEIYIYGGKVNATGGISGAGIGGGTWGTSGKIRVQKGLYGDTVIATRGQNEAGESEDLQKDIGHGDHIHDLRDKNEGGSADTDADIDAPGIIGFDSTWSDSEIVEKIADSDTALSNIRQLFDETGKSLLTDPQTLTLNLGNGSQTRVTLYADDDLNAVVKKVVTALNGGNANAAGTTRAASSTATTASSAVDAASTNVQTANASTVNSAAPSSVATSLAAAPSLSTAGTVAATLAATPTLVGAGASGSSGSGSGSSSSGYTPPIEDHYTTYIAPGTATPYTSESVEGTLIFRSMPTGVDGALAFAGSRELLESLALNTIQEARENEFIVNITDAHTGRSIVSNLRVTGNHLNGVLHKNVDIEWDDMAGVEVRWNDEQKKYEYTAKEYTTYLHLHDNSTTLQVGANEGDELDISIGDMSAHALGVDKVNVASRDAAARGITLVDNAIDRVSLQRSRLGAWQNRLEHTMDRLEVASENLTAAEIRIRDADMARETMNIAKLKIMLDAGNSVFSQANQLPQHVMSLIR
ncbi:MAG: hypothetical protein IJU98_00520 [Synergistaceae bacterium]|nr:hypothetical protein [Synergistaceae bacterium]